MFPTVFPTKFATIFPNMPPTVLPNMFSRETTSGWLRQAACGVAVGVVLVLCCAAAQGAEGTWNALGDGDWEDPANWLGSVPNGPGDVALFDVLQPSEDATVTLRSPITVGGIEQANPNRLEIGGAQPLSLAAAGSGAVVRIHLADGAGDLAIEAPATLTDDDLIATVVPESAWLQLPHLASSGSSNLTKEGAGGLSLGGNNPAWTGLIAVDEGMLRVLSDGALGVGSGTDADATTVHAAGTLVVNTGRTVAGEKIRLAGGTLAGDTTGTVTIGGPVELLADSVLTNLGPDGGLKLTGAVSGPGGAMVGQGTVDLWGPLSFAGPLRVAGGTAKVRVASTHGGSEVGPGGRLLVTKIGSLVGAGQTAIRAGGELRIVKPAGNDPATSSVASGSVLLDGGMLTLANGDFDPAHLLAPASTGGVLALENQPLFTAGGSNLVDFEAIGGSGVRLGAMTESTIPAAVRIVPDAATRTLRFGGAEGTLTIESVIEDTAGGPTHLDQDQGGTTVLAGANTYTGTTTVRDGTIVVEHASALGSPSANTVLNGGVVRIDQPISEPFVLQAGTLETTQHFLDLSGPLTVTANNTAIVRGAFNIRGGSTGAGDLHLVATDFAASTVSGAPLSHQGGLILASGEPVPQFADFRSDNSYTGRTEVSDVSLELRTANGLGSPAVGTSAVNSVLRLHGNSQESVYLDNSTLSLWSAEITIPELRAGGTITLKSSRLDTYGTFRGAEVYVVEKPVILDGGTNVIATDRGALRLDGGVEGQGDLIFDPDDDPIIIASSIDHSGALEIRGGPVRFQHRNAYSGTVLLRNSGRLIIETDQQFDGVMTSSRETSCCSTSGFVEVMEGASLTAEFVQIFEGLIKGDVQTEGPISFRGFAGNRTISHLNSAVDVNVFAGELAINDSETGRAGTNGDVVLRRHSEAAITLPSGTVGADIYLNNGTGFGFGGALRGTRGSGGPGSAVLTGDLYLGDDGAYLGGDTRIRVEGRIHGGDLILGRRIWGRTGLTIVNNDQPYTGKTKIYGGQIVLAENGRLSNTSGIELFPYGRVFLDSDASDDGVVDRLDDDLPVRMHGGEISTWAQEWGINTTERIGSVTLDPGLSFLSGGKFFGGGDLEATANLLIGELVRNRAGIVAVGHEEGRPDSELAIDFDGSSRTLLLENPPSMINGILPPWITVGRAGFAAYNAAGVEFATLDVTSISSATPESNVRLQGAETLAADAEVNSLMTLSHGDVLDLGAHSLTIGSGGLILNSEVRNGTLRAGDNADGELIVMDGVHDSQDGSLAASIEEGDTPLSVTYVVGHQDHLRVKGDNRYSGPTHVVGTRGGDVNATSPAAIPTGGDIEVNGNADLNLSVPDGNSFEFGTVTLRNGGGLFGQYLNAISADMIRMESGGLGAAIVGDTPIVKTTDGVATLFLASPDYTGTVDVYDGILRAGDSDNRKDGFLTLGQSTVTIHGAGRLVLSPVALPENNDVPPATITLNGGSLYGGQYPKDYQLNLKGVINVVDDSNIYLLNGFEPELEYSRIQVEGQIRVAAGVSLSIVGRSDISSDLVVSDGFLLEPNAVLGGNGGIQAQVDIANGTILSPGLLENELTVGTLAIKRPFFNGNKPVGAMTWGVNGRYRWEINHAAGTAGAPFGEGWDLMIVEGDLTMDATEDDPFVIQLVGLDWAGQESAVAGFDARHSFQWLIASAGQVTGFDPARVAIDASGFLSHNATAPGSRFELRPSGSDLLLLYRVPEPSTLGLLAVAAGIAAVLRRRSSDRAAGAGRGSVAGASR